MLERGRRLDLRLEPKVGLSLALLCGVTGPERLQVQKLGQPQLALDAVREVSAERFRSLGVQLSVHEELQVFT